MYMYTRGDLMYQKLQKAIKSKQREEIKYNTLISGPWPLGLNTILPPASILPEELSIAVNVKMLPLGNIETREGLTRYTTSVLPQAASCMAYFPFEVELGNVREWTDTADREWANTADREWAEIPAVSGKDELIVTQPDNKLYYLSDAKAPVEITTLEGNATIIPLGDKAVICDGSFLKYWDKATDTVKILYDNGSGVNGYQHDNTGLTEDTQIKLYNGNNTKAGVKFEAQYWDSEYTIPILMVEAYARRVGSPTGNVGCELYTNAGVLVSTSTTTFSSATISDTPEKLEFVFDSGSLSPQTLYWAVMTYSGGDVSNYVQLECNTVASGGDGKYYDNVPSWQDDALKLTLMAIKPGRPPRGQFGIVDDNRVYVAGDPYNKGIMWYSNVGTNGVFDWSTSDGGGYVGAIDANMANFPIGAIISLYGNIYVFGQESQPYLCKLTGDSPSSYSLPLLFQKIYSTHKTALEVVNDIWFANESGVNALSGVEQYGDLRTFNESETVEDRIVDYWTDDDAFAGYYGATGQYFLKLKGYPRCLVAHTKLPIPDKRGRIRYPLTDYVFVKKELSSATYKWALVEKITNGNMELDANWNDYGSPSVNERSNEQAHGGTYSRKFTGAYNAGIKSDTFTTVTGQEYTGELWIYPVDCTEFGIFIKCGDNSGSSYGAYGVSGLTANTWNKYEFTYTETAGGSGAYIALYKANTYYIDDISIILPDNYYVELATDGDPSLTEPPYLLLDDSIATAGTLDDLADHEWAYGDNDSLGYSTIYIRDDSGDPDVTGIKIFTALEPTAFANYRNKFLIAFDDGYIYKLDSSVQADNSVTVPYVIGTKLTKSSFNDVCLEEYDVLCSSNATTTIELAVYDERVSVDTLHSVDAHTNKSISIDTRTDGILNANYKEFMSVLHNIGLNGKSLKISGIQFLARLLHR